MKPEEAKEQEEHFGSFEQRDKDLRTLGFASYSEYLASDLWAWIRTRRTAGQAKDECRWCHSTTGLVWHHRVYWPPVLAGSWSNARQYVVRVCSECHHRIHKHGGEWLPLHIGDCRFIAASRSDWKMDDELPTSWPDYSDWGTTT